MEEESTAQELLELIKWRTVCHFFYDDVGHCTAFHRRLLNSQNGQESPPYVERETVLHWIEQPRLHSRKLERLLKLPYSWQVQAALTVRVYQTNCQFVFSTHGNS